METSIKPIFQRVWNSAAVGIAAGALALCGAGALAQQGPGVTDTEVKIGAYLPLTGPIDDYGIPMLAGMSLNSFAMMKVFIEAVRRINGPINRQSLVQSMDNLRNYDTGILPPVSYSSQQHLGTTALQRVQISGGKWITVGDSVDSEMPGRREISA